ncbi:CapA family protein [Candidatus Dojkabacteria bacterium]|nr:CapA family protein [Candidatus Dojkabacteria bacterium]
MRSIIIIFLVVLVITLTFLELEKYNNQSAKNIKTPLLPSVNESNIITKYLIPVTSFTNTKIYENYSDLLSSDLYTLVENEDLIPEEILARTTILETIKFPSNKEIYLITPEQVKPWFRTVQVGNDSYYWSKDFSKKDYPLYKEISSTEEINENPNKLVIFAAGEIIPARAVDRLGLNKYNDYTYLFDFFKTDIQNADISIGLLENSVIGNPAPCTGCMLFVGDDKVIKGLADVGFDFITTAGNHAGDAGQKAYLNTINLLTENNIQFTGTGNCSGDSCLVDEETKHDAFKPIIKDINGFKIGMISADDVASYYWKSKESTENFGTNNLSKIDNGIYPDLDKIQQLKTIKNTNKIDYLIVYMSWGIEYMNYATKHQQTLGILLIDNGADIIIGSHPHWVQNIEFYKEKPIIYSLGNFIFDQTHTLETRQGAAVNLYFYNNMLKNIEIMPHQICGYHQTKNDLAVKLINKEFTLENIAQTPEKEGCVYWQPQKLKPNKPEYLQVLERMFEHTQIVY